MRSTLSVAGAGFALVLLATLPPASAQAAGDVTPELASARYLASNCANCHGTDGRSAGGGGMPGLAGLSRDYFIEQMRLFRDGERKATIMHQLAKGYTEEEFVALADFFSRQDATK